MTMYLNPIDVPKETWLEQNGELIPLMPALIAIAGPPPDLSFVPDGTTLVCMVDNGPFRAAAAIVDMRDLSAFAAQNDDPRPKSWWLVESELLKTVLT